jgi:hypothetical protein
VARARRRSEPSADSRTGQRQVEPVKSTPATRVLAAAVNTLDRYWGPLGVAVVVALEALVFAPRGESLAMIVGAVVGTALLVAWLIGEA